MDDGAMLGLSGYSRALVENGKGEWKPDEIVNSKRKEW